MSVIIKKNKKFIIDRTLPEIMKRSEKIDENMIKNFLTLLKEIGVDLIEINKSALNKIKNFPRDLDYIYHVDDICDIYFLNKCEFRFKYIAVDYKKAVTFNEDILNRLKNKEIIIEADTKILDKLFSSEGNEIFNRLNISCLRIKGIVKYNLSGWSGLIENIKTHFSTDVDFCPDNSFYMATAIGMEACSDGADFITAAFNGQIYGFASLEEIVLGLKVIKKGEVSGNLKLIGELSKVYTQLTGEKVYCMKAVIGEDIFKYESGIHVDGIAKNPYTYEPYNPYDIGEKRTMYIGKHSGKKAVMLRLKELNIDYEGINGNNFLSKIREVSIKLKRNIFDEELIQIYNDFKNTCLQ